MPDSFIQQSVTAADIGKVANGIINLYVPIMWDRSTISLPPELPVFWSWARDETLRATIHHEAMWAAAVGITITKVASKAWEIKSDSELRSRRFQELFLNADTENIGWVQFLSKHLRDFLTTDNGAFVEIVRDGKGENAKITGIRHLDSRRCQRTGDPEIPILFRDRLNRYHELKKYQVMMFADMPDPSELYFGVGLCSASRAYRAIYKLAAIETYLAEKVAGLRPLAIHIVNGMIQSQIEGAVEAAREQQVARGVAAYMGAVIVGVPSDKPPAIATIPLAELPDRFQRKEEFDISILTYADALGLDPQDLQPLTGQSLGSGAQSVVLHDKAAGKGLVSWQQQWTHQVNNLILPDKVSFEFVEKDYRDMEQKATIRKARAEGVKLMIDAGMIMPNQGVELLVNEDELPKEFLQAQTVQEGAISDTEKPLDAKLASPENAVPGFGGSPAPEAPGFGGSAPEQPAPPAPGMKELLSVTPDNTPIDPWQVEFLRLLLEARKEFTDDEIIAMMEKNMPAAAKLAAAALKKSGKAGND